MTHTCLSIVHTKSLEGVFQIMRLGVSFHYLMATHVGAFQWLKDINQSSSMWFLLAYLVLGYF